MVTADQEAREPSGANAADASGSRFISCCPEELVELELEALRQGGERARADGADALHDIAAIGEAAAGACDRALAQQYMPLDERRFREVFTLSWCAGYHEEVERARLHTAAPTRRQ
jgi:hypothetical protein